MSQDIKLALVRFLYNEFGYQPSEDDGAFEQVAEGIKGQSSVTDANQTRWYRAASYAFTQSDESALDEFEFNELDANIYEYLESINDSRESPIKLRYYQYMAVFFTEYLFKLREKGVLLERFNSYIKEDFWQVEDSVSPEDAITKLAYWMATGSGKTYIMHINILQSKEYFDLDSVDNLMLIAPTEQVAEQNKKELQENGIPVASIEEKTKETSVRVTDIHKLTESDGDKSFNIREYGSNNIIFVDEAHKGLSSSNVSGWVQRRDTLSKDGFAFEYSATFASSLSDNSQRYDEYSRSIIFDYPYGRFHSDRYGKDYNIVNVDSSDAIGSGVNANNKWLLANLLSFYEKLRMFESESVGEYNIEKPLAVFIGNSVNAVGRKSNKSITDSDVSDVQEIIEFLDSVVQNKNNWVFSVLDDLLSKNEHFASNELFGDRFDYLRQYSTRSEELYKDLLNRVFNSRNPSELVVSHLKNLEDKEIGITTDVTEGYVGVITIGDTSTFMDRLKDGDNNIRIVENETHSSSLFDRIDKEDSNINILIGSKKFAEGWDSTRPSVMGLLKVGQNEGPLIVQMFGRGVRVNGVQDDGKRSHNLPDSERYLVERLETLDIFGVKANYLEEFKEHLEEERINLDDDVKNVSVSVEHVSTPTELRVPTFAKEIDDRPTMSLESLINESEQFTLNDVTQPSLIIKTTGTKVTHTEDGYEETKYGGNNGTYHKFTDITFRGDIQLENPLDCLDWDSIWHSVLSYKQEQGYSEIIVEKSSLYKLIENEFYELKGPVGLLKVDSIEDLQNPRYIENLCAKVLSNFLDNLYSQLTEVVTYKTIKLEPLDEDWIESHTPNSYDVSIRNPKENEDIVSEFESQDWDGKFEHFLLKQLNQLYSPIFLDSEALQEIDINESYKESIKSIEPEGIDNTGERKFIEAIEKQINVGQLQEYEVVIMRNQSNSGIPIPGVQGKFYPDFVIWVTVDGVQHIILADPHGMVFGEKSEFDLIRRVNEKGTSEEDVEVHACLFARTKGANSFEEGKKNIAQQNNTDVNQLRDDHTFFIDDTVSDMGNTYDEVERMLKRYIA